MKQVLFSVEDESFDKFMGLSDLIPGVKALAVSEVAETRTIVDQCVAMAINELCDRHVIRRAYDYTYIMMVINQENLDRHLFFASPQDLIDYLGLLGPLKKFGRFNKMHYLCTHENPPSLFTMLKSAGRVIFIWHIIQRPTHRPPS